MSGDLCVKGKAGSATLLTFIVILGMTVCGRQLPITHLVSAGFSVFGNGN